MKVLACVFLCALIGLARGQRSNNNLDDPCNSKTYTTPHETQCDAYYKCSPEKEIIINICPNGLVYSGKRINGLLGVCDYDHNIDCTRTPERSKCQLPSTQVDACTTQSGVVGDNTYCDRYWECVEGHADLYNCPNGLVFVGKNRGIAEGCDYPWRGSYCQNRVKPSEEKPRANPPISTTHCDWLYGIFGHETSCTRYWTCWNGTATEQFCIGGLLYNEETHACDWPQNVQGCQKHPLCRDDPNANVPLGKSCERYWSCQGGYPRLQRCPATLVFDKQSRRCVSPPTVDCEAPVTQAPSEYDGTGFDGAPRRNNPNRRRGSSGGRPREQQTIPQRSNVERPFQEEQRQRISETSVPRPRRPLLPNFPAGATQIEFNTPQQRSHSSPNVLRPAPIAGAIPLRQN